TDVGRQRRSSETEAHSPAEMNTGQNANTPNLSPSLSFGLFRIAYSGFVSLSLTFLSLSLSLCFLLFCSMFLICSFVYLFIYLYLCIFFLFWFFLFPAGSVHRERAALCADWH